MKVYFWGTRGSLPVSLTAREVRTKIAAAIREAVQHNFSSGTDIENFIDEKLPFFVRGSYGGNTSCVEIRGGDEYILCDAGTGLRDFGNYIIGRGVGKSVYNIFMSHLHWDHIQGFPFFVPAFIPGNQIRIYSFHHELEDSFKNQQKTPLFPVPFDSMPAEKQFIVLETGREYQIGGWAVSGIRQNHPGDSYGYCFERDGKKIVYSTDSEHMEDVWNNEQPIISFFRNADLLIFDSQYSFMESTHMKENWGHSSNLLGVELSVAADVKYLCLFHNEPACNDETLDRFLEKTKKYLKIYSDTSPLKICLAYDGLEIEV
jgi:phosphoribosyl 1,2-cyclic phosphodiesterase